MQLMVSHLSNFEGISELESFLMILYTTLLKFAKSSDTTISEKIKFHLKDPITSESNLSAICDLNIISFAKPKTTDAPLTSKKTKKITNPRFIYDFDYYDKSPFLPFWSENNICKIICVVHNFEKMIRYNILDCINKLFKIEDLDKETFLNTLEESYRVNFINPFLNELAANLKKDIITIDVDLTPQQQ